MGVGMNFRRFAFLLSILSVALFLSNSRTAAEEAERDPQAASHKTGDATLDRRFSPRAIGPSKDANQKTFIDLYYEYGHNPAIKNTYLATMRARGQDVLVKRLLQDFGSVLGGKVEWAIMYAEGINNHKAFGADASVGHRHAATALAELIGSLPSSNDPRDPAKNVKSLRDRIERELERHEDRSEAGVREKAYLELLLKALDESVKAIEEGDEYKAPKGADDDSAFRREVGNAMSAKLDRTKREKALIKALASAEPDMKTLKSLGFNNIKDARDHLRNSNPGTLLTHAAQLEKLGKKDEAAELIRALIGDQRDKDGNHQLTFWDRHTGKRHDVSFGSGSPEDVAATIQKWEKRYRDGDFTLKEPPPRPATTGGASPVSGQPTQSHQGTQGATPTGQPPATQPGAVRPQPGQPVPPGVRLQPGVGAPPRGVPPQGVRQGFFPFRSQIARAAIRPLVNTLLFYPDTTRSTNATASTASGDTAALLEKGTCLTCHTESEVKSKLQSKQMSDGSALRMPPDNPDLLTADEKMKLKEWADRG